MAKVVTFGELMIRLQPYNYERFVQADHLEFSFGGDGGLGRDPKLTSGFGDFRGARDDVDAPGGAGCREKCDED